MTKLEQRLKKNDELREKYFKFMGELFSNGHAITVDEKEAEIYGKIWYQSHFCVTTSSKFRVVFDCSAKFQGVCVNDFLYKGPTMRNSLVGVLMRFRTYLCALISDIRKLYYQCEVKKDHQNFLRFLWYKDNDFTKAIVKCKMTRLSFGLLPAQSAALFCLEKTLYENVTNATSSTILKALKSFYVDDGLFSFSSEADLVLFFKEIVPLLASRGFPLTKFFTTSEQLKTIIPKADLLPVKTMRFKDENCL